MQHDETHQKQHPDSRDSHIKILLDDKCAGWGGATDLSFLATIFDGKSTHELREISRRMSSDAWAYRDELEAKPSSELREMARAVLDRRRQEYRLKQEAAEEARKQAMFPRWARKASWEPSEAARLACGHDPKGVVPDDEEFSDLLDTITRAIQAGQIEKPISPPAFLAWLQALSIPFPPGLAAAVAELRPTEPAPEPAPDPQERPPAASPFDIEGYDCPEELRVMMEAIKLFWVNADPARPPKKEEEIIPWIRERVDSDAKARRIDELIRPEWARNGGQKKSKV